MKKALLFLTLAFSILSAQATIHVIQVWSGYYQFLPATLTIQLGDMIHWLPLDPPSMPHTVTSSTIPVGAAPFDEVWYLPTDTFVEYVPTVAGVYDYVCTPHVSLGMVASFTVQGATAIDPSSNEAQAVIQSPGSDANTLRFTTPALATPFELYGLNGKLLMRGTTDIETDVSSLSKGLYLIVLTGDIPRTVRFVKY